MRRTPEHFSAGGIRFSGEAACHHDAGVFRVRGVDFESDREWCVKESLRCPGCVCGVLLPPWMEPEKLISEYRRLHFKAVKPYFSFAGHAARKSVARTDSGTAGRGGGPVQSGQSCCILPNRNVSAIRKICARWNTSPGSIRASPWQLAHCARSFNSILLEKPLRRLKGLEHICYDLSAVCDDYSMYLLFRHENRSRLMFGTDAVVNGGMRGTYACIRPELGPRRNGPGTMPHWSAMSRSAP